MVDHWHAGYKDTVRTLSHPEVLERPKSPEGVFIFDIAEHPRGAAVVQVDGRVHGPASDQPAIETHFVGAVGGRLVAGKGLDASRLRRDLF
jgi:hypothetical protein